jgi:beta-glucanase (GH16 family)
MFSADNVRLEHGYLALRSTPKLLVGPIPRSKFWVNSAILMSKSPIATNGYYEARISASDLAMTSSFWLQRPEEAEIDVTELFGHSSKQKWRARLMASNTHYFGPSMGSRKATPRYSPLHTAPSVFHIYGAWWKDRRTVWFYLDGRKVYEVTTDHDRFTLPMYLIFDTEVFPELELPTLRSLTNGSRNTMRVDWVRSWVLAERPQRTAAQ